MPISTATLPDLPKINPGTAMDTMLKNGVHRIYETLIDQNEVPGSQIRRAVVDALDLLTRVDTTVRITSTQQEKKRTRQGGAFFSSIHGERLEFCHDAATDDVHVDLAPNPDRLKSRKQKADRRFKKDASNLVKALSHSEMEKSIATAIMGIFTACEDFAGPVQETFTKYRPLFEKLRLVYEKNDSAALLETRGCYSSWFALDQPFVTHDIQREEDTIGMMG